MVAVKCVRCGRTAWVNPCSVCHPDYIDDSCDECEGAGWTDDGEPGKAYDTLCDDCWRAELDDATRDWCC